MSNINVGKSPSRGRSSRRGGGSNRRSNGRRFNGISVSNATNARNKYLDKAKEALGNGDKISAENFFQHADHYARIVNEHEEKNAFANAETNEGKPTEENKPEDVASKEDKPEDSKVVEIESAIAKKEEDKSELEETKVASEA